ncbi:MAG: adenosine kinase [Proteobacteria bacterium]|nr:adenosine kinase [Pseudomonadota bacterium]
MTDTAFDVLGIGNAIVDVIAETTDAFLDEQKLDKGIMRLIDEDEAARLYGVMGPGIEVSGGSAANTIAGVAALGGRANFIGRVRDDELGDVFAHDIRAQGVSFASAQAKDGPLTARCLVLVTPDAQRTMNTYLGACVQLSASDVDRDAIAASRAVYLEGYLWDAPEGPAIFAEAAHAAAAAGREVAMTLSDPFCVDRYRDDFLAFIREHVDILFANEIEIASLYQVESFEEAARRSSEDVRIAALTRSEKGSVIVAGSGRTVIGAHPTRVVDTTGAGDLYAAGFLYGYATGASLEQAGRIGSVCAGEIISHIGARPRANLRTLIAEQLG